MKIKLFTACSFILLIGVVVYTLISNSTIQDLEESRDKRLEYYELTKQWVMEDLSLYLKVKDNQSYTYALENMHLQEEFAEIAFGSSFNASKFPSYQEVSFIDAQYTLEKDDGTFIVYLLTNVTKDGKTKSINFLVFIEKNKIYDIIAY